MENKESKAVQELRKIWKGHDLIDPRDIRSQIELVISELSECHRERNQALEEQSEQLVEACRKDVDKVRTELAEAQRQLSAATKRLAWFDANKPEGQPDVQEAVIRKLGLVDRGALDEAKRQLAESRVARSQLVEDSVRTVLALKEQLASVTEELREAKSAWSTPRGYVPVSELDPTTEWLEKVYDWCTAEDFYPGELDGDEAKRQLERLQALMKGKHEQ